MSETTRCKYQVNLRGHYGPGTAPLTREGVAWLINYGDTPSAAQMANPAFLARVDAAIADLKAGRIVRVGAADLSPLPGE